MRCETMGSADLSIQGESAVVTGSGRGIGREIARQLSEAGVNVAINDIDETALEEAKSELSETAGDVVGIRGDASDPSTAETLVSEAREAFGRLDIVVNNVGIAGPTKSCEDIEFDEFMNTLSTNLGSLFNTSSAAIPHLRESPDGRIVNLSSMSGKRPLRDRTPYTTSKMGVIGFTRTLAIELADDDVNVNAICPGSVRGPRLEAVMEGQAESQNRPYEEVVEEFRSASPMDTFVEAEDVANLVCYLCSEQSAKITGQDVNVTAGITMY
jgi:NAD(P)-dependent dehydrogenase (short-subunit alcohol dehydrogenase family)